MKPKKSDFFSRMHGIENQIQYPANPEKPKWMTGFDVVILIVIMAVIIAKIFDL